MPIPFLGIKQMFIINIWTIYGFLQYEYRLKKCHGFSVLLLLLTNILTFNKIKQKSFLVDQSLYYNLIL